MFPMVLNLNPLEICTNYIIEIYEFEEFMKFAQTAPLIIYEPEFFSSPFLDEHKIRCVNCYAIGVRFQGLPTILKFQKNNRNTQIQPNSKREHPTDVINSSMRAFINEIKCQLNALKGSIHGEKKDSSWNDFLR